MADTADDLKRLTKRVLALRIWVICVNSCWWGLSFWRRPCLKKVHLSRAIESEGSITTYCGHLLKWLLVQDASLPILLFFQSFLAKRLTYVWHSWQYAANMRQNNHARYT